MGGGGGEGGIIVYLSQSRVSKISILGPVLIFGILFSSVNILFKTADREGLQRVEALGYQPS